MITNTTAITSQSLMVNGVEFLALRAQREKKGIYGKSKLELGIYVLTS